MISTSFVAFLMLFNLASSQGHVIKRQSSSAGSAAAAAALILNQSLAYQICLIAAGSFAAVQAIQGTKLTAPVCTAPVIPRNIPVMLTTSGCYSANDGTGSACYSKASLTSSGYITTAQQLNGPAYNFTLPSSNSSCTGLKLPFKLAGTNGVALSSSPVTDSTWNIDCSTGAMSLPDPTLVFCLRFGQVYSALSTTCISNLTISAVAL